VTDADRDAGPAGDAPNLVAGANENLRLAFARLAEEIETGDARRFGPLAAACAGVQAPFFNRVFVVDAPPPGDLSAAVAWASGRDVPFWVTVTGPVVEAVASDLAGLDLAKAAEQPGMAMTDLDGIPRPDSVAEIVEVTDSDDRAEFSTVTASAFGMSPDVTAPVDRACLAADGVRLFLGKVDGAPAASGLLVRSGAVAGVYWIGVIEEFRRRGIGRAMSRAVLRAGRDAGCRVGVLQASEMGYPLYEEMGFETIVTYHHFERAD
jgi:GNAT superfamily N-acetyltransferase